jgi:hypothetical protein
MIKIVAIKRTIMSVFESRRSPNGVSIAILPTYFILCFQIANTVYAYYTLLKNVADS